MSELPLLSVLDLRMAGRHLALPFRLALPDGGHLEFTRLLRLLPGKRLSGAALWNGRPVFAKLFIAASGARRHGERERDGLVALQAKGLPTPALLGALSLAEGAYLVLSEFFASAHSLDEEQPCPAEPDSLLAAFALLGRLHAGGLVHQDLHLGNFLHHGPELLFIDGDGVRTAEGGSVLNANLALLLSQLNPDWDEFRPRLLAAYGRALDKAQLDALVDAARERRLRHCLGKTVRNCTTFAVDRKTRRFSVVLRTEQDALGSVLRDPDAALAGGMVCKDGGTCTVACIKLPDRQIVIKRYNLKHWRHALSRAWRPSRAWHSWQAAHRLAFYGIATPQPLAMIEERLGPLRGRAFLITDYCPGSNLLAALAPDSEPASAQQQAIVRLFNTLQARRITHGDLKASNLLWQAGEVVLIDLDAMLQHRSESAFRRSWQRDRRRLLRNWPSDSVLGRWLDQALPPA